MSTEDPGSSRQGDFGTQLTPDFEPLSGDMSTLLGDAGTRVTEALRNADEATRRIFAQATRVAREHHEKELEKAQRMTRERIEKLTRITAEVSAQGAALQEGVQELATVMRRSTESMTDELGLSQEPEAGSGSPAAGGPKKSLQPDTMAGYGSEGGETKPPVALRELFGFKRKRSDNPPVSQGGPGGAQMLVAGYSAKVDR